MIPAGTELHCTHCGQTLTKVIKDLPDDERVRNIWDYMENGEAKLMKHMNMRVPYCFEITCESCGKGSNLYALIMEELDAGSL